MINLRLDWPPTINTYYTVVRNRKILSARGRKYKKAALLSLMEQSAPRQQRGAFDVLIDAYPPDKRRRDLDNVLKPILDCLTDYGLWDDDVQVEDLRIRRRQVQSPGFVRICITEAQLW